MSSCTNCAALQAQIDALLASRASRSSDTAKAKRAIALPRSGHRLAILTALQASGEMMPGDFPRGMGFGTCPWKRLSELHQLGLVSRTDSGAYYLSPAGHGHLIALDWLNRRAVAVVKAQP